MMTAGRRPSVRLELGADVSGQNSTRLLRPRSRQLGCVDICSFWFSSQWKVQRFFEVSVQSGQNAGQK